MFTHFPPAVPEIPVSNVDKAAEYYVNVLGFQFDWGDDAGGIGGISQGDSRIFLTNPAFREHYGTSASVMVRLNLNSKQATTGITAILVIAIVVVLNFLVGGLSFGNFVRKPFVSFYFSIEGSFADSR